MIIVWAIVCVLFYSNFAKSDFVLVNRYCECVRHCVVLPDTVCSSMAVLGLFYRGFLLFLCEISAVFGLACLLLVIDWGVAFLVRHSANF